MTNKAFEFIDQFEEDDRDASDWQEWIDERPNGQIRAEDWIELTKLPLGSDFGLYSINEDGVFYKAASYEEIERMPSDAQAQMLRNKRAEPLRFPCSVEDLMDFVTGPRGSIGGDDFKRLLPKNFLAAASAPVAHTPPTGRTDEEIKEAASDPIITIRAAHATAYLPTSSPPLDVSAKTGKKRKQRIYELDAAINKAIKNASGIKTLSEVWFALKDLARTKFPPFTGDIADNGDLVYTNSKNEPDAYGREALRKWLDRDKARS